MQREEILLTINEEYWDLIKSGKKTLIVKPNKPKGMFYPFRVLVYVSEAKNVVGKFDVHETFSTIRPEDLLEGSCMTLNQIIFRADGKPICGWRIKENSVFEYETPIPLEVATGLKMPPSTWRYVNKDVDNE